MPIEQPLPLFPLELVLYPTEQLPLHIFEPRYQELTRYCLEHDRPFGVVLAEADDMAEVGCTARIIKVLTQHGDGRRDILIRGDQRFRLSEIHHEEVYLTAQVEEVEEVEEPMRTDLRERAVTQHMKLLEVAGRRVRPSVYQNVEYLSYLLGHNAGMSAPQKQQVLELPSENERLAFLVDYFEALIPRLEDMEQLRQKIKSNGHFRDFPSEEL